ncbi:MAG: DUF58 domain-containing protein, partial [Cellulomonadaceae bacterium]
MNRTGRATTARGTGGTPDEGAAATWMPSSTAVLAAAVGVALAAVGLALARPDVVLLGLPLVVTAAWTAAREPATAPARVEGAARPEPSVPGRGDAGPGDAGTTVQVVLEVHAPARTDAVQLRVRRPGQADRDLIVTACRARRLTTSARLWHTGVQRVLVAQARLLGSDAAWVSAPTPERVIDTVVAPRIVVLDGLPLPYRLGLTGAHDSLRPGDGGEFRDLHLFTPGDRLRRIDWRATARRAQRPGELYVRRTGAAADATVVLVTDSRDDVGAEVAQWGEQGPILPAATSMDLARQGAASVAVAYARAGDRVGLVDLGSSGRALRPGAGTRHLDRMLRAIARSRPVGDRLHRVRAPVITQGALVYVFSTFLDGEASRVAAMWRAGGHRVIAVDTLPPPDLCRAEARTVL